MFQVTVTNKPQHLPVSFTMFRDVLGGGANYDLNAQFGIYRKSPGGSDWTFVQAVVANPTNIANIPLNDPCDGTT
ncbi:MAG: hypothetical protein IPG18_00670 [Saprospiraceae bacterium]|nr:hypothetical protein [Saprospiraceae bacterium]